MPTKAANSPRFIRDAATKKRIAAELRHPSRAQRKRFSWAEVHEAIEDGFRPYRRLLSYLLVDADRIIDAEERIATPAELSVWGRA